MKLLSLGLAVLFVCLFNPLAFAETGKVTIRGTTEGSPVSGKVLFQDTPQGLRITADVSRVPPGKHGFHIHEYGSCGNEGKDAGGHYNPDGVAHGLLMTGGFLGAHAGDLGNIEVGPDGTGKTEMVIPGLSLSGGKYSVGGRGVILHEKGDDFGQPVGNAGGRIGCGTIKITGE